MTLRTVATFALFVLHTPAASLPTAALPSAGFADIVEKNVASVVRIMTTRVDSPWASDTVTAAFEAAPKAGNQPGPRSKRVTGEGSGVIVSADGYVLTNHHVIHRAIKITVELNDDRSLPARLIASDPSTDLAVLKIDAKDLQPIVFGDSQKLRVGEVVLAIGNPFGVGTTVTSGIVSAMSSSRLGIPGNEDYIQTDAAINPGNSGGPLLNASGQLIGINTAIISPSGGSSGIGFALPSNIAHRVMTQLIENGHVRRGYLGIGLQPISPQLNEALNLARPGGAIITDVAPDSPAAQAGLQKGDVIQGMNGRLIRDFDRLRLFIAEAQPHAKVQLAINRDGKEEVLHVTLAARPDPSQTAPDAPTVATGEVLSGAALAELTDRSRQELGLTPDLSGILVVAIDPSGDSAESGLQPGDIIVAANRQPVSNLDGLRKAISQGKVTLLEVNRHGGTLFFAVPRA